MTQKLKHFEVLSVEIVPGGAGPDRCWKVYYKAYMKKKWVEDYLWSFGRTADQAKERAEIRHGTREVKIDR